MACLSDKYTAEIVQIFQSPMFYIGCLQEFYLIFTSFIMSNDAFYNKSSISMSFAVKVHYVPKNVEIAVASKMFQKQVNMSISWLKIKVLISIYTGSLYAYRFILCLCFGCYYFSL